MGKENAQILTTSQMRAADEATIASGVAGAVLMERAGAAVVDFIKEHIQGKKAVVLVGPGNNGGDGFVIARLLSEQGWQVDLVSLIPKSGFKDDAALMADKWAGPVLLPAGVQMENADVIVDALFGTGLQRPVEGEAATLIELANGAAAYRVAVDIPSGISGDDGQIAGVAFKADATISFAALKPGHLLIPGRSHCGMTQVADIGIDIEAAEPKPFIRKNTPAFFNQYLSPKNAQNHKYDHGHALILGGHRWASGASRLCADAALRVGAGLVTVLAQESDCDLYAAHLTSVMLKAMGSYQDVAEEFSHPKATALCLGPGAGMTDALKTCVLDVLAVGKPVILDADALSVFESEPSRLFEAIQGPAILTPHMGEFKRLFPDLLGLPKTMQALEAARRSNAGIVLKGADTVIAAPDGRIAINCNAPHWLATAGSGDVLAGLVTGLAARAVPIFEAACAAVWLHGEIGQLAGEGLIAEDMRFFISKAFQRLSTVALS